MKALIVTRAGIGGAARHVLDVVGGLAGRHEITVLASPLERPGFLEEISRAGARAVPLPLPRAPSPAADLRALAAVRALLARRPPDVIHAHTAKAGALARLAARGVPVVYSPHGFYHHYPHAPRGARLAARTAERLLAPRTALLALAAAWEREAAAGAGLAPPGGTVVIPNGVATNPLPERPLPGPEPVVLMVGRLAPPKDPLAFLAAAARSAGPGRWVLAGDGPLLGRCRRAAPSRAEVRGRVADPGRLLAGAAVAVLATRFEAAPYFLLEAMAAARPVVAADLPATREMLGDAGVLVPPGDPGALAAAVDRLLMDPGARAELGARGRQRAAARYPLSATLRATEEAWRRARGPAGG